MRKIHTVNQLAKMAGVSVRTLHHYDRIGLLKPAHTGENRYRYYGEEELLRLQQILLHRALGMPLSEIAEALDAPGFDRIEALQRQRERVAGEAQRFSAMLRTIDRTIARLKGDRAMKDADLYSGIVDPDKQAEYEAWLIETYGPEMETRIETSRKAMSAMTKDEIAVAMAELKSVEDGLAEGLRRGIPAQSSALDPLVERHRAWVGRSWGRECPPEAYAGLADVYEHPDFEARYEAIEPRFGAYLRAVMRSWAARHVG